MYRPRAVINLSHLKWNYRQLQAHVGGAKVLAVVKADAYGHGIIPIARSLEEAGCHGFAVAVLPETLELRERGIHQPILHMGRFLPETLHLYQEYDINLTVHDKEDIAALSAYQKAGGNLPPVHLKVDTGMGRLGVAYEHALEVLENLNKDSSIRLEGIYSHFSTSAEAEPSFMRYQLVRFGQFVHAVRKMGMEVPYFHTANSGAIVRDTESHFNMVRPGLLLYGVRPGEAAEPPFGVRPVMKLEAPLVLVRDMPKGMPVGYGRTYRSPDASTMGVLQIGYADGIPVVLSGKGAVAALDGKIYPLIGRVSMDTIAIRLEGDRPEVGLMASLWGDSGHAELNVEHLADLADTIPYELLVNVGTRVERIYVEN